MAFCPFFNKSEIRHNHDGWEFLPFSYDHCLFNEARLLEPVFHRLRHNVLTSRSLKYFLFTICNAQEFSFLKFTDIACAKPTLGIKYFFSGFFVLVIAHHNIRPFDKNLTVRSNFNLYLVDKRPNRTNSDTRNEIIDGYYWRCFSKAISLENWNVCSQKYSSKSWL